MQAGLFVEGLLGDEHIRCERDGGELVRDAFCDGDRERYVDTGCIDYGLSALSDVEGRAQIAPLPIEVVQRRLDLVEAARAAVRRAGDSGSGFGSQRSQLAG